MTYFAIPEHITIGFQKRDTKTGRLAFLTYKDAKGNLKCEKSFKNWIDVKIPIIEIDNNIITELHIGRTAGGYKSGWNYRQEYVQLSTDTFTFEIATENFIDLLMVSTCSNGILTGEFKFAWYNNRLALLPINSPVYKEAMEDAQSMKVAPILKVSDLKIGHWYKIKSFLEPYVYIGSMGIPTPDFKSSSKSFFWHPKWAQIRYFNISSVVCEVMDKKPYDKSRYGKIRYEFELTPYSIQFWKKHRFNIDRITPIPVENGLEGLPMDCAVYDKSGNVYNIRPINENFVPSKSGIYTNNMFRPSSLHHNLFFKWFSLTESPDVAVVPYRTKDGWMYYDCWKNYDRFGYNNYGISVLRGMGDYNNPTLFNSVWEKMDEKVVDNVKLGDLYKNIVYQIGPYQYEMGDILSRGFLYGNGPILCSGDPVKLPTKLAMNQWNKNGCHDEI